MIRNGSITPEPKHRAPLPSVMTQHDTRDYAAHVCPGMHCLGRVQSDALMKRGEGHRHGGPNFYAVHTLTAEQAARATEYTGRVR